VKDALLAGGIVALVIGCVLYFVPRFLAGSEEQGGRMLRIEPVAIQTVSSSSMGKETIRYSIRIVIADFKKSDEVCRYAPHVVERVQELMRGASRGGVEKAEARAEQAALEELRRFVRNSFVRSVHLVRGERTRDGYRFPKVPPNTMACIL